MTGKIKSLNAEKGYGWIIGDDKQEYFVHRTALKNIRFDELQRGQAVTFDETESQKGKRAENVFV